jgi:hypothetical protein
LRRRECAIAHTPFVPRGAERSARVTDDGFTDKSSGTREVRKVKLQRLKTRHPRVSRVAAVAALAVGLGALGAPAAHADVVTRNGGTSFASASCWQDPWGGGHINVSIQSAPEYGAFAQGWAYQVYVYRLTPNGWGLYQYQTQATVQDIGVIGLGYREFNVGGNGTYFVVVRNWWLQSNRTWTAYDDYGVHYTVPRQAAYASSNQATTYCFT